MRVLLLTFLLATATYAAYRRTDHPNGFSLTHPAHWLVESVDGKIRAYSPDRSEFIAIEPVSLRADAASALRQIVTQNRLLWLNGARLAGLRSSGQDVQAHAVSSSHRAQLLLAVRGGAATLYLAAAPANRFAERLPELVRVLQSFSFRSPSRTTPLLRYAALTEPQERAYSLQFPAGWNHSLGVYREGALPPRFESSAVAPDRAVTLFLGDRSHGVFTVPSPSLPFREGSIYDPSGIHPMRVLRYLPGEQFAQYWLPTRLNGARVVGMRSRPDWASQLAAVRYRYGNAMNAQVHAGELTFDYQGQRGTAMVATEFYRTGPDGAQWTVCFFAGYMAASGREEEAVAALTHAVATTQINLNWLRMEKAFARLDHARAVETIASTNQLFRQTFAERVASSDRNARAHGDLLAGAYRVLDPQTNEYTTVQAGSNFYYRVNGTNAVVGSNAELAAVDLTRMLRLDWDTQ